MSQFVNDIVEAIRATPETFIPIHNIYGRLEGISDGTFKLTGHGNTPMLSMIKLYANGAEVELTTYIDRWKMEKAITWWYKTCPADALTVVEVEEHKKGYI